MTPDTLSVLVLVAAKAIGESPLTSKAAMAKEEKIRIVFINNNLSEALLHQNCSQPTLKLIANFAKVTLLFEAKLLV